MSDRPPERSADDPQADPFFAIAQTWLSHFRAGLDAEDPLSINDSLDSLALVEAEAISLRQRLSSTSIGADERHELVCRMRELGRAALICSALSENGAMYTRLGQSLADPSPEYTSRGSTKTGPVHRSEWEA